MEDCMWDNSEEVCVKECERKENDRVYEYDSAKPPKKHPGERVFLYDVSQVQAINGNADYIVKMISEMDSMLRKKSESYAGTQVYQTGKNLFVIVTKYYDCSEGTDDCSDVRKMIHMKYKRVFGRGWQRKQILNHREARRIYMS